MTALFLTDRCLYKVWEYLKEKNIKELAIDSIQTYNFGAKQGLVRWALIFADPCDWMGHFISMKRNGFVIPKQIFTMHFAAL